MPNVCQDCKNRAICTDHNIRVCPAWSAWFVSAWERVRATFRGCGG